MNSDFFFTFSAAAETPTSFARSRYSHAVLLSLNAPNTALAPDVCNRLCSLEIYDRNQTCPFWKRKKRPCRARCRHRDKTVDTTKQKHPFSLTRYADKLCCCFAISDGLLPTNLLSHVCSAQLSDHVDQLGISPGSHRRHRSARKRPYRGGRCRQGQIIPVIVTNRSWPRILHPLCTSTHDSVRHPTDSLSAIGHMVYLILT